MAGHVTDGGSTRERTIALLRGALPQIKAIGLDFDNTIADEDHWVNTRWRDVLGARTLGASDMDAVATMRRIRSASPGGKRHLDELLEELGASPSLKDELLQAFLTTAGEESVLPGALELVHWAKTRELRVGILTNGRRSSHAARLATVGIADLVDAVVYGDADRKPSAVCFERLIEALGIERAEQLLYIGDSFAEDVAGACAAGAYACWLRGSRKMDDLPSLPSTAFSVTSFEELRGLLMAAL